MTRINLVDPSELMDQHLIREYGELPRIFGNVMRAVESGKSPRHFKIPSKFVLGTGHMTFFYNKLLFLEKRYDAIVQECVRRDVNITFPYLKSEFREKIPSVWWGDYTPTNEAIALSIARIQEKLDMRPGWYRHYGQIAN